MPDAAGRRLAAAERLPVPASRSWSAIWRSPPVYFDCEADPEATYKPSDNDQLVNYSIVTERPGLVCVDESEDGYYAGAAHPYAQENIECFDTGTHAAIEFQTVFPALTSGSPALAAMMKLVDGHLELTCCDSDATKEGTFADIGMDDPAPSGWAVNDDGDLILAFEYSAFGRSFQATATVPRAAFIDQRRGEIPPRVRADAGRQ